MRTLLTGGVDGDGHPLDLLVDDVSGTVVDPHQAPDTTVDCAGMVLLPAPAEPHVHLDKVGTASLLPNPTGDLAGAVEAWVGHLPDLDADEVAGRATTAIDQYVANGATALRTHVDVKQAGGLEALRGVLAAKHQVADRCDVQVAVLFLPPLDRTLVLEAMALGADVVGGAPHIGDDPEAEVDLLTGVAAELGLAVDLHTDETLDPSATSVLAYADLVAKRGLGGKATASHCVSLGVQPRAVQQATAARLAEAGVAVVALPATNLWLQGRSWPVATPRGLTAVRPLLDAGVTLAAGADNLRDPFCPMGRSDPMETASLLAITGHLTLAEAWHTVSAGARQAMGLPTTALQVGQPADVLAIAGTDLADAVALASPQRTVLKAGRLVARTTVTRHRP